MNCVRNCREGAAAGSSHPAQTFSPRTDRVPLPARTSFLDGLRSRARAGSLLQWHDLPVGDGSSTHSPPHRKALPIARGRRLDELTLAIPVQLGVPKNYCSSVREPSAPMGFRGGRLPAKPSHPSMSETSPTSTSSLHTQLFLDKLPLIVKLEVGF